MGWWPFPRRTKRPFRHDGGWSAFTGRSRRGFKPRFDVLEDRTLPASFTVSSLGDSGPNPLRDALIKAGDGDVVQFAPNLNGQTIVLTSGTLALDDDIRVVGPGANLLTVRNDSAFRTFTVTANARAGIQGLTLLGSGTASGIDVDP